ncbi:CPBP family intramembrane glutamic endopeptidase [Pseudaestuariivita rosea]|uniref:CPBP family intramembrane glutamic endopeptidase n=1 Tax=Pseudaestuariivita rosea TaxID=2763263 RepID=UPI001F39196E|nr:type II CAAX endopeptidase family protein [Pseudaestuariivita rosea]
MQGQIHARRRNRRLWAEFVAFFCVIPLIIAVAFPPSALFPLLFSFTALGIVLLHITPGFDWRSLLVPRRVDWGAVLLMSGATALTAYIVMQLTAPGDLFILVRQNPALLIMIALLYPVLSALPQELVFRPLFFRRYAEILPDGHWPPIILNATLFAFAHLMYWNWIVIAMTFFGGLAFAWAYQHRGSFTMAVILHSLAGIIVFAFGLGMFFYSGNVQKPF